MWAQRTATALSPSVQILPGAVPPSEPRGSSVWSGRVQEVLAATRGAPRDLVAEPRLLRPRPLRPVSMNGLEHILFFSSAYFGLCLSLFKGFYGIYGY